MSDITSIQRRFLQECSELGIFITNSQLEQFEVYRTVLQEWNKQINLTAVDSDQGIYYRHFLDSLSLSTAVDINSYLTMADIGSGAGFPGIPLKIAFPNIKLTLVESISKKTAFMSHVISKTDLKNVEIVGIRAEGMSKEVKYDLITARAVSEMSVVLEICLPFVKKGGVFAAYKQENVGSELKKAKNALSTLGGALQEIKKYKVYTGTEYIDRSIILIKKVRATPEKYPRRAGILQKRPL